MKIGIYPGSFDPVTLGHLDVIKRSAKIMDELVIGVLANSSKTPLFTVEDRVKLIECVVKDIPNVKVMAFDGLTVDFAKKLGAKFLIRGLRAITDFEYELQIAQTNHKLDEEIDTVFFTTSVEYSYLSSSIVKEIASYGGDISKFVPKSIIQVIYDKYNRKRSE
ncbi:pantetheine-phosphate adenylyltransferase [Lachnoclostridium phytofermentans]|jgi:pantetheine-phosphate adenylyltransferase|uniref:pantetheine-phosphate adenylyltransferase n=1 Tax=Lachnoclostridium phytofermentans TaxID=66219 RepID=UPI000498393F|nr:pantetheine-phosphate adenylyltransferase [Lachnoclostridium phytofermentans]